MTLVQAKELPQRTASKSSTEKTRTRIWQIVYDSTSDGPDTAEDDTGISLWDQHPTDTDCYAQEFSTNETENFVYEVTVTYKTLDPDRTQACELNPLACPLEISWSTTTSEEIVDVETDGTTAIVNSAGDPYNPAVTREVSGIQLDASWNVASFNGATAFALDNRVNSDTFEGAAPGTLKISGIKANTQRHEDIGTYWRVSLTMKYKPSGWQATLLDAGMRKLDAGDRAPILINGREITDSVPLDGAGDVLAPNGAAVFNTHNIYFTLNYTSTFS